MAESTTNTSPKPLPTYDAPMTWADVLAHPALQDLPFKIELNEHGQILMSPTSNRHSRVQRRLMRLLEDHLGGEALPECNVNTSDGVKVADIGWAEVAFFDAHDHEDAYTVAPPICVEVESPSNTEAEMQEKVTLYLAKGAQEVWLCDLEGHVRFFGHEGQRSRSRIAPDFPAQL